ERHALLSFGQRRPLVLPDIFNCFRKIARKTAYVHFQRSRKFAGSGHDREIESARRKLSYSRILQLRGIQFKQKREIDVEHGGAAALDKLWMQFAEPADCGAVP